MIDGTGFDDKDIQSLGACRTYTSRLNFCPSPSEASLLLASSRATFVRFRRHPWRLFFAIAQRSLREPSLRLASLIPAGTEEFLCLLFEEGIQRDSDSGGYLQRVHTVHCIMIREVGTGGFAPSCECGKLLDNEAKRFAELPCMWDMTISIVEFPQPPDFWHSGILESQYMQETVRRLNVLSSDCRIYHIQNAFMA